VACRQRQLALDLSARLAHATAGRLAAEAAGIDSALRRAALTRPDVLLLEYTAQDEERTWHIMSCLPQVSANTRVLMLCQAYTHRMIVGFVRNGASGCLPASSDASLCAKAVRAVHGGETWFGRAELLQALRRQMAGLPETVSFEHHEVLTAREREVIGFVGDGLSNKEIARRLNISDKTVKTHLHRIYVKLHKSGRYKAFLSNTPAASPAMPMPGEVPASLFAGDRMSFPAASGDGLGRIGPA
jgi:DNA-binding NarL/FixJ family response regulator